MVGAGPKPLPHGRASSDVNKRNWRNKEHQAISAEAVEWVEEKRAKEASGIDRKREAQLAMQFGGGLAHNPIALPGVAKSWIKQATQQPATQSAFGMRRSSIDMSHGMDDDSAALYEDAELPPQDPPPTAPSQSKFRPPSRSSNIIDHNEPSPASGAPSERDIGAWEQYIYAPPERDHTDAEHHCFSDVCSDAPKHSSRTAPSSRSIHPVPKLHLPGAFAPKDSTFLLAANSEQAPSQRPLTASSVSSHHARSVLAPIKTAGRASRSADSQLEPGTQRTVASSLPAGTSQLPPGSQRTSQNSLPRGGGASGTGQGLAINSKHQLAGTAGSKASTRRASSGGRSRPPTAASNMVPRSARSTALRSERSGQVSRASQRLQIDAGVKTGQPRMATGRSQSQTFRSHATTSTVASTVVPLTAVNLSRHQSEYGSDCGESAALIRCKEITSAMLDPANQQLNSAYSNSNDLSARESSAAPVPGQGGEHPATYASTYRSGSRISQR